MGSRKKDRQRSGKQPPKGYKPRYTPDENAAAMARATTGSALTGSSRFSSSSMGGGGYSDRPPRRRGQCAYCKEWGACAYWCKTRDRSSPQPEESRSTSGSSMSLMSSWSSIPAGCNCGSIRFHTEWCPLYTGGL